MRIRAPRVLLVGHRSDLVGGAQISLAQLATALQRDGRVEVVVSTPEAGPLSVRLEGSGVATVAVATPAWSNT